ncbi:MULTISPECIES: acyltransferase family protein [Mesorhizobium]|uniref:acyltransferase family protein n=1 Tax=Mesorhizobium australicum TaxID=536018 RepID=UPI003337FC27
MGSIFIQLGVIAAVYGVAIFWTRLAEAIAGSDQDIGRDECLNGLRGTAAVAVVACHINQYMCAFIGVSNPFVGDHLGILAVQLFFCLTAYLFTDKALKGSIDPAHFFANRVRRILPLYIFAVVAALAIALCYSWPAVMPIRQTLNESLDVVTFGLWKTDQLWFRGINMLSLIGVAWTLSYEWAFYVLLVPGNFLWRCGIVVRVCIAAIVGAIFIRDFYLSSEQVIWPFFLPGVAAAFSKYLLPERLGRVYLSLALPSVFLVIWLPGFWTPVKLALVTPVFFAVTFGKPRWLGWPPLQTLGVISYSIYLIQYLVLYPSVQMIYTSPALASVGSRLWMGVLIASMTIVLASLTYRFVERPWVARSALARVASASAYSPSSSSA